MTKLSLLSDTHKATLRDLCGAPRGRTTVRITAASQSAAGSWTPISWGAADEDDLSSWSSARPTMLKVPPNIIRARFEFYTAWQNSGFGFRYSRVNRIIQGHTVDIEVPIVQDIRHPANEAGASCVSRIVPVVPGDDYQLICLGTAGGDVVQGTGYPGPTWLSVEWFGITNGEGYWTQEDGSYVLQEDGVSKILLE